MSKYKTPLPITTQPSKGLENRTSKYRLPFKKDEPTEDLQMTLNNLSHNNIALSSSIKFPKLTVSSDLNRYNHGRKHKNNLSIHEEVNLSVKSVSEKQQIDSNYQQQSHLFQPLKGSNLYYRQEILPKTNTEEDKPNTQQSKHKTQKNNPKLSLNVKKRRRFLSSSSKYAEDEINEDTQQSEDEKIPVPLKKDKLGRYEQDLPTIGQNKTSNMEKQDSDQDIKIYETLSKDIKKYQDRKASGSHKSKQKSKLIKSISKRKELKQLKQNQIEYIENQLKKCKDKKHKRSQSMIEASSIYEELWQNNEQANKAKEKIHKQKQMKKTMDLFRKFKQIISTKNSKPNHNKLKMPLQFYLNSYDQIKSINPFFRKLNQMQGCILLNIGKLIIVQAGKNVYSQGDISRQVYIIIYGKVLLSNKYKTLKKFALTGQTLAQEQLFENEKKYMERLKEHSRGTLHKDEAKTLNRSCLLKIHLHKYYQMYCELNRMGYKQEFNLIDNLFRINYINKQNNLHQHQRGRLHTELPQQKQALKFGPFFH